MWCRYLDDCFIIMKGNLQDLNKLHHTLNSLHPCLKFTMEHDNTNLPFLDIMVINNNCKIETDIYFKKTDSKQYLLYTSCHPRHIKNNIPYCLARRITTIVSENNKLEKRMEELNQDLIKRKFPILLIQNGINKAMEKNQCDLRQVKNKNVDKEYIPYVSTFNPNNPDLFGIIKQNQHILERSDIMESVLKQKPLLKSKRQAWNLQRILTRARFDSHTIENVVTKCHRGNCGLCKHMLEGNHFTFATQKTFKVNAAMSCDVKNVIYVITCRGCGENYIGETTNLRHRTTVHNQQIRDPGTRKIPLSAHLDTCSNADPKYFIFPFYKMPTMESSRRKMKEAHFIKCFKPKLNKY